MQRKGSQQYNRYSVLYVRERLPGPALAIAEGAGAAGARFYEGAHMP